MRHSTPLLLPDGMEKVCSTTPIVLRRALSTSAVKRQLSYRGIHILHTIRRNVLLGGYPMNFIEVAIEQIN